jgi:hypothetical protein
MGVLHFDIVGTVVLPVILYGLRTYLLPLESNIKYSGQ